MNLQELVDQFRRDSDDRLKKYLFQTADVVGWLAEAEKEASIRKRLLYDDYTEAMTVLDIEAGTNTVKLDPRWFFIDRVVLETPAGRFLRQLTVADREQHTTLYPGWRYERGEPEKFFRDEGRITLPNLITRDYVLRVAGWRTPLLPMNLALAECGTSDAKMKDVQPEIAEIHHDRLPYWALHKAYMVPDRETYDPDRAATALAAFEGYFGERWQPGRHADNERQARFNRKW